MNEQEIKGLLLQLLDEQKKLREDLKELQRRLDEKVAGQEIPDQLSSDEILEHQQPEAVELWKNILAEIKERIPERSFATWFKATQAIQIKEDTIIIWSPNEFARDWLHSRYSDLIEEILQDKSVSVRHVHFVAPEKDEFPQVAQVVPPPVDVPPLTRREEAAQIWLKVCTLIQDRITRPSFDTWFKGTESLGIHEETLYVSCANDFAREWIYSRFGSLVQECIDELGSDVKQVEIISKPEEHEKP